MKGLSPKQAAALARCGSAATRCVRDEAIELIQIGLGMLRRRLDEFENEAFGSIDPGNNHELDNLSFYEDQLVDMVRGASAIRANWSALQAIRAVERKGSLAPTKKPSDGGAR